MKLIFTGVLLLIFISVNTFSQINYFSVKGREITDLEGKPIVLKGINLGNWLVPEGYMFKFENTNSPRLINETFNQLIGTFETKHFWQNFQQNYITNEDIKFIKKAGFNSIRLPFNYRLLVTDDDINKLEGPGYDLIDKAIQWCKEENLYVILDMHCAPDGQTGDNIDDSYAYPFLFESPEAQELTAKIWGKLALKYANENIVIGYDLLNEPIPHFFDKEHFNPLLEPLYKKLVSEVRKYDRNHICFLGGAQWDSNFEVFGKPFDDKLVYTFHKYWTEPTVDVIKDYISFSEKNNVPIWMGESGENTFEWINSFRKVLEDNNIGWCFWPYKKLDAKSCIMSVSKPEGYDEVIKFAQSDRSSYEKVRTNRPSIQKTKVTLQRYLENIRFSQCKINQEYLHALGLTEN